MTNKQNLPKTLVRAIENHEHKGDADISASQLLKSPRAYWLEKRHSGEVETDVSQNIWALFGTATHGILESGCSDNSLVEEFFAKHQIGEYTISGSCDLYEDGYIYDWKTVSVWSLIFLDDAKKAEYISQLNAYALFFRSKGFEVKGIKIVMLMRDWQKSKSKFDASYPNSQVQVISFPLYTNEQTTQYIASQIEKIMKYKDTADDQLPLCSSSYRWAKPSKWALMKKGRKSAVKLYDNEMEAHNAIVDEKNYVEERVGEPWKRCEYCSARKFCNQTKFVEEPVRPVREIKVEMSFDQFMKTVGEN